jgi:hypothetical protein
VHPVPCKETENDFKVSYDINQKNSREILRDAARYSTTLGEEPGRSCAYLNRQLLILHTDNAKRQRDLMLSAPLKDYPSCKGKGSVDLEFKNNAMAIPMTTMLTYTGLHSVPKLKMTNIFSSGGADPVGSTNEQTYAYRKDGPVFFEPSDLGYMPQGTASILNAGAIAASFAAACCDIGDSSGVRTCQSQFLSINPNAPPPALRGSDISQ